MGINNIEKKSWGYNLLWSKIWVWHNLVYYRNVVVQGKENIPKDKLLIFTPNHQNSLMDALAVLFSSRIQFVFLARADIFKKPAIAKILYFLKILPIYRARDGYDSIEKSNKIFERTVDILTAGCAMVILPEGNHSRFRKLRPLKKGFARMAFKTEEANNYNLDIRVVPVGIDYDDFSKYRSSLVIKFGTPVKVLDFVETYKENEALGLNKIKDKLSEEMAPLIPNIQSEKYYDLYNELRVIYRSRMARKLGVKNNAKNRVSTDQVLISRLSEFEKQSPEIVSDLNTRVNEYKQIKKLFGLSNNTINKKGMCFIPLMISSIIGIATLPLFLYGVILNILPYWLPIKVGRSMPDEQFQSSVKFVLSFLLFPIFYILESILFLIFTGSWEATGVFLISMPVSAAISWKWTRNYIWFKEGWTYFYRNLTRDKKLSKLKKLYTDIINITNDITG